MTEWTAAVWGAIGCAFAVGLFVGVLFTRFTSRNVQKQLQLETDLKEIQAKADAQKQQLEQHFSESALLLATLAENYKDLYRHLAESSAHFLSEEKQTELFKIAAQSSSEAKDQPRDYSEGSSGLLKIKQGEA